MNSELRTVIHEQWAIICKDFCIMLRSENYPLDSLELRVDNLIFFFLQAVEVTFERFSKY